MLFARGRSELSEREVERADEAVLGEVHAIEGVLLINHTLA